MDRIETSNVDLNKLPNINFVYDICTPNGPLPFGYNKYTIGENILRKFNEDGYIEQSGYYSSIYSPGEFLKSFSSQFLGYLYERTPKTNVVYTASLNEISSKDIYLVVLEALNVNNLFEYYSESNLELKDYLSPKLISLLKTNKNFKLVFMDTREGAYIHSMKFLQKLYNFLKDNNINHPNKIIVSTNNNFITNLYNNIDDSNLLADYKNKISLYCNNYNLLISGKFIMELKIKNNKILENDYEFSLQDSVNVETKKKHFLMYNRNSERMHRPYFLTKMYLKNLLNNGYISFFENEHLDSFLDTAEFYKELDLNKEDLKLIKDNYKNFYPLIIDDSDSEKIANYHNFLSRKDEYQNSYFTIISETNAESDYCFITEKTVKPIMNLHPFIVLGNPNTLKVLKSYGIQTFDRWWDESYDAEFDFKKRADMVLNVVETLTNKTFDEWNLMISEMQDILNENKNILKKLYTNHIYEKEFLSILLKENTII